ncbi:Rpn family recombination-promoting nuclease/putative transposase [Fortiea contorta]|uniref:Rpn family recombination-promoting nuclease/putative transposase n=1 Tax=Fortiea contorta TaxID=1892405 RepID=UPI000347812B|nr:Rpn family recombination-promoting nuclease/putative transposase [Fortiea contorta]
MKTDSIFYRLFQEFPHIFFELIGNSPAQANIYQFSSVEIKQTAFRIDGVFVPIQGDSHPIYFAEVQFQTDSKIYSRLFAEVCLYLRQNQPQNDWGAVVLYPSRSVDVGDIKHYREFFSSQRVKRIYIDELGESASLPIGVATAKLVVESEDSTAIVQARELIDRTKRESNSQSRQKLLQLIETILLYKFPNMSREDVEKMFGLSELKQTKFYQEVFQEGVEQGVEQGIEQGVYREKLRTISRLLKLGFSIEQVAEAVDLSLAEVRKVVNGFENV